MRRPRPLRRPSFHRASRIPPLCRLRRLGPLLLNRRDALRMLRIALTTSVSDSDSVTLTVTLANGLFRIRL